MPIDYLQQKEWERINQYLESKATLTTKDWQELLKRYAPLDKAKNDEFTNYKAALICISCINKMDKKQLNTLTTPLAEEDLNVFLLAIVEAALADRRKKEKDMSIPSLKDTLNDALQNTGKTREDAKQYIKDYLKFKRVIDRPASEAKLFARPKHLGITIPSTPTSTLSSESPSVFTLSTPSATSPRSSESTTVVTPSTPSATSPRSSESTSVVTPPTPSATSPRSSESPSPLPEDEPQSQPRPKSPGRSSAS
jgi:hypothetical protein